MGSLHRIAIAEVWPLAMRSTLAIGLMSADAKRGKQFLNSPHNP
jgi:hypothetical protein